MKIKPDIIYLFKKRQALLCFMKILIFLFCTTAFSFAPQHLLSQNARLTIETEQTITVDEVFEIIQKQTPYHFVYQSDLFKGYPKVTVEKGEVRVDRLLEKCLNQGLFDFQFLDDQQSILITKRSKPVVQPDKRVITGVVSDKDGFPLPGVNILVKDTNVGTLTDFEGAYSIEVEEGQILVFSYLGYETKEVEVTEASLDVLDVLLVENLDRLDEVVLIGYQKVKASEVTGAVSSINTTDLQSKNVGVAGFARGMGGLVKGLRVSQNTGVPGSLPRVNIRGYTSPLSGSLNQPLYVIDGVPVYTDSPYDTAAEIGNPILNLDPNSIESIDVLKDAAATSIYGSRGANGVILIETKAGKRNQKPQIQVSYSTSFGSPIKTLNSLGLKGFKEYSDLIAQNTLAAINAGQINSSFIDNLDAVANITQNSESGPYIYNGLKEDAFGEADNNWNDLVYRNVATTHQLRLGFNGGSEFTDYAFDLSGTDQEGLRIDSKLESYNLHSTINSDLTDYVKAGGTVNLGYNRISSGAETFEGGPSIISARPDIPVRDEYGELVPLPSYSYGYLTWNPNPLAELQKTVNNKSYSFIGNTYLEVEPIDRLTVRGQVNGSMHYTDGYVFTPKIAQIDQGFDRVSSLVDSDYLSTNMTLDLTANYQFNVAKNHSFNLMTGYSWDRNRKKSKTLYLYGFPDDDVLTDVNSAEKILRYPSEELETGMNSFFSRLVYGYKGIYNATLNFRSDASSKFGPGNKRGYFPSASVSWNLSNMNFLVEDPTVNNLKLRLSYGKTGSSNISDFTYLQFFDSSSFYKYGGHQSLVPAGFALPNPDIKWETTLGANFGVDYAFFDSRLYGSVDVYNRQTSDALAPTPIPLELGAEEYTSNLMDLSNKGVEVELNGTIIKNENFNWNLGVNWAFNRNKLENLHGANIASWDLDYYVEGKPIGTIKGYEVEKIITSQEEVDQLNASSPTGVYSNSSLGVGDYMFRDVNGDGKITADDRVVIGNPEPKFFGGFNTTFQYENFSFGAFFEYSVGGKAIWSTMAGQNGNYILQNKLSSYAHNTWTPDNPDARYARALYNDPSNNGRISDRYVFDKSYLRLSSLQLSYTLDQKLLDKWSLSSARIFIAASNVFTWTSWPGIDPGASSTNTNIAFETENTDPYPLAKTFSVGVEIKL